MEISKEIGDLVDMLRSRVGSEFDDEATFSANEVEFFVAVLHAEPCEPVAWMFEGKGWGREVMLSEQEALERKERLSRTWDITITPLYSSPAPSLGVDIEALQRRVEELEAALKPFADRANRYNEVPGIIRFDDSCELWQLEKNKGMEVDITVGDLRRAAALIQEQKKDG